MTSRTVGVEGSVEAAASSCVAATAAADEVELLNTSSASLLVSWFASVLGRRVDDDPHDFLDALFTLTLLFSPSRPFSNITGL